MIVEIRDVFYEIRYFFRDYLRKLAIFYTIAHRFLRSINEFRDFFPKAFDEFCIFYRDHLTNFGIFPLDRLKKFTRDYFIHL